MSNLTSRTTNDSRPVTKTEYALQYLRERIASGALVPGCRLDLRELRDELGISPTPIREALRLLQADRLIDYEPHRSAIVAKIDPREVAEALRLRALLEAYAITLAAPTLIADLSALEKIHHSMRQAAAARRTTQVAELNRRWHWEIIDAADSHLLRSFIERLWMTVTSDAVWALPETLSNAMAEHEAVMQALRTGDTDAAAEHLRADILYGLQLFAPLEA